MERCTKLDLIPPYCRPWLVVYIKVHLKIIIVSGRDGDLHTCHLCPWKAVYSIEHVLGCACDSFPAIRSRT